MLVIGPIGVEFALRSFSVKVKAIYSIQFMNVILCKINSLNILMKILGHLVSHRRTHAEGEEGAASTETPAETEDCTDCTKCVKAEPERTNERKLDVRLVK